MNRRDFLRASGVLAVGTTLGTVGLPAILGSSRFAAAQDGSQSLRAFADKLGIRIGIWVGDYNHPELRPALTAVQTSQFNMGLISMGWWWTERERGVYRFRQSIADLGVAAGAGMKTIGNYGIWPWQAPDWIRSGNFSRAEMIQIIQDRMRSLREQLAAPLDSLTVVIEAYRPGDVFQATIGDEYVDIAFEAARRELPNTELVYTDYDNHVMSGPRSSRYGLTKTLVDRLRSKGLIDKVGVELGLAYPEIPSRDEVIATMQSYGLPVVVTEFNVRIHRLQGSPDERFAKQAQIYGDMLRAAINSGVCSEIVIFQMVDRLSSWETSTMADVWPDNDPTPYDDDLNPKPAYFAMLDVLREAAGG